MTSSVDRIEQLISRIKSKKNKLSHYYLDEDTDEIIADRLKYVNNFRQFCIDFIKYAGINGTLYADESFDALVRNGQAILNFEMNYSLIAAPPRVLKTTIICVLLPAYAWTYEPGLKFMGTCYAHNHAMRDNKQMQQVIQSKPYQRLWGKKFRLITTNKIETANSEGGKRVAVSLHGQGLGSGGDIILIDDPNSIREIPSPTMRERAYMTFENTFIHRRNNPERAVIVILQQRLHHEDYLGHVLSKKDKKATFLEIPMEYDPDRHCKIISPKTGKLIWEDKRIEKGEILCPKRFSKETLMEYKANMGTNLYNCLFQASPSSDETSIFKHEWFQIWNKPYLPDFEFTIQSWDTAISTSVEACYSAGTTFGLFYDENNRANLMLLSLFVGKLEWNELLTQMIRMSKDYYDTDPKNPEDMGYKPDFVLVEAHANGISLVQELSRRGVQAIKYYPPRKASGTGRLGEEGKVVRARTIQPLVENKRIFLRASPFQSDPDDYGKVFRTACKDFPSAKNGSKDIVDTFSMAVDFLIQKKMVKEHYEERDFSFGMPDYIPPRWTWDPTTSDKYRRIIK